MSQFLLLFSFVLFFSLLSMHVAEGYQVQNTNAPFRDLLPSTQIFIITCFQLCTFSCLFLFRERFTSTTFLYCVAVSLCKGPRLAQTLQGVFSISAASDHSPLHGPALPSTGFRLCHPEQKLFPQ